MTDVPLRVQADDPEYQRQLAEEAAFWEKPHIFSCALVEDIGEGPFDRYRNRRFTGEERTPWFETIVRHGQFRRGLLLGVSGIKQERRILESNPTLHLTMMDASAGSLQLRGEKLGAEFGARLDYRQQDFNFIEIDSGAYDVIISSATLHHVINIEHLAAQVARGLAPGGWFFLQDYVSEEKFQFSPEKRSLYEAFLARSIDLGSVGASSTVRWPALEPWEHSPFEAIRSSDTLDVFAQHLHEVSRATAGAMMGPLMFTDIPGRPNRWRRVPLIGGNRHLTKEFRPRFVQELQTIDEVMCDSGVLLPLEAFAIYRKNA